MNARVDLASPERTAARTARMEAARQAKIARATGMSEARALIRKYGVRNPWELLALLATVQAAIPKPTFDTCMKEQAERLSEHLADLDEDLNTQPTAQDLRDFGREQ